MLEKSDTSIGKALRTFNYHGLEVGLLVPTDTGMKKSIMDATAVVRGYFVDTRFHDYGAQDQGPDHKITKRAFFIWPDRLEETTASLYRPNTKKGDPRIWFSQLRKYAEPFNLLAIIVRDDCLYIVNCSRADILESIENSNTPLGNIAATEKPTTDPIVEELLDMIREVYEKGYVRTKRPGDTGVGMTLETLLGISANIAKTPDYKGIEIKAKRLKKAPTRVTLFSQVPNWKLSPIGCAWNLLSTYGYHRDGKLRLNHQMSTLAPNSLGFVLKVDTAEDWLKQNYYDSEKEETKHITTWEMRKLRERLCEKHPQTFWVGAKTRGSGAEEEFHYTQLEHTKQPKVRNFDALIESGIITVDYLMSERKPGAVRDHGYLFKMNSSDFYALFPPSEKYAFE